MNEVLNKGLLEHLTKTATAPYLTWQCPVVVNIERSYGDDNAAQKVVRTAEVGMHVEVERWDGRWEWIIVQSLLAEGRNEDGPAQWTSLARTDDGKLLLCIDWRCGEEREVVLFHTKEQLVGYLAEIADLNILLQWLLGVVIVFA